MVREPLSGLMAVSMKVNMSTRRNKVTGSLAGLMEGAIWGAGRMANKMAKEYTETEMEYRGKDYGATVRKLNGLIDILFDNITLFCHNCSSTQIEAFSSSQGIP